MRFIIILLNLIGYSAFAQKTPSPNTLLKEGYRIYANNTADTLAAMAKYREAYSGFLKEKNYCGASEALLYQGALLVDLGAYQLAENILYKGIQNNSKADCDSSKIKLFQSLAFMYHKAGLLYKSSQVFFSIDSLLFANPDLIKNPNLFLYHYANFSNQASFYHQIGDLENAKVYFKKATEFSKVYETKNFLVKGLRNEANFHNTTDNFQLAKELYSEALKYAHYQSDKADIHTALSILNSRENKFEEAKLHINKANLLFTDTHYKGKESISKEVYLRFLLQKAHLEIEENQLNIAKNTLSKILNETAFIIEKAKANELLSFIYTKEGNLNEAEKSIDKALALVRYNAKSPEQTLDYILALKLLYHKAENALVQNKNTEDIYLAISVLAKLAREYLPYDQSKAYLNQLSNPYLLNGLRILKKNGNPRVLFTLADSYKGGILQDNLEKLTIKKDFTELALKEKELISQLQKNKLALVISPNDSILLKKQNDLKLKQSHILNQLNRKKKSQSESVQFSSYQEVLRPTEYLIEIADLVEEYLIIGFGKQTKIKTFRVSKSEVNKELEPLLSQVYNQPGLGIYTGSLHAQKLYDLLLKPLEQSLGNIRELIIIRDGDLNKLAFDILEDSPKQSILEKYAISYDYSATIWKNSQYTRPIEKAASILAIAPYANQNWSTSTFRGKGLGHLPFSKLEVEKISGTIYQNKTATKKHFLEDYQKHGIIHFATHAQMDDTDPAKSFIAFYPDSSDYKLYTEELYNLSLKNTQLVVLSACEAGGGKLQQGEGLMSLARGFAYAGCPAVITTLWKANDQSTAWLSERLYHYLKKGWNKAAALRQAKLDFRASDIGQEFDHPYYWANFILIGNNEPLERSFWELYKWWTIGSFLLLLVLSIGLWRLRK